MVLQTKILQRQQTSLRGKVTSTQDRKKEIKGEEIIIPTQEIVKVLTPLEKVEQKISEIKQQQKAFAKKMGESEHRAREIGDSSSIKRIEKNASDMNKIYNTQLAQLKSAKSYVKQGYTAESSIGIALGKAQTLISTREQRERAVQQAKVQQEIGLKKQVSELEKQGIKPIYFGGKLTGFEDTVKGMSIGINQAGSYFSPTKVKAIEQTTGIKYTMPVVVPKSEILTINNGQKTILTPGFDMGFSSAEGIGGFGKQEIVSYGKPIITSKEAKGMTTKQLERYNVIPEGTTQKESIEYAKSIPKFEERRELTYSEKLSNVFYPSSLSEGEIKQQQILEYQREQSFGELFSSGQLNIIPIKAFDILGTKFVGALEGKGPLPELTEKQKKQAGRSVGEIFLFSAFSPAFTTGGVQLTEQEVKQLGKSKFSDLSKQLDKLDDAVRNIRISSKATNRESIRKILQSRDPKKIKAIKKIFDESLGKKASDLLFKDVIQQEFIVEGVIQQPIKTIRIDVLIDNIPQMKGIGPITGFTSNIFDIKKPTQRFDNLIGDIEKVETKQKGIIKLGDLSKTDSKLNSMLGLSSLSGQKIKQDTVQTPKLDTRLISGLTSLQIPKTAQIPKTTYKMKDITGFDYGKLPPKEPTPRVPPPFFWFDFDKKRKGLLQHQKIPHDLFVKSKGKYRKVANNITKQQALDLGSWTVDTSTSAQFKIKQDKGKLKKPKYNIPSNYWEINSLKFRPYRVKKGVKKPLVNQFIEKRNRRIDTQGEKKQLSYTKQLKKLQRTTNFGYGDKKKRKSKSFNIAGTDKNLLKVFGF